ncbi:MAG: class II fumarate hydratase [Candidatus Aminicenantes bacterium]|nr:class II fumarate hydratase [Candidatus Aminicenantes bacterium]
MSERIEKDSLGEVNVPSEMFWGAQTQRALGNFKISGIKFQREFIRALGIVKRAAADANIRIGLLDPELGKEIIDVASEIIEGDLDEQFPLDIFQTGSGTSFNMNANEVIANKVNMKLGKKPGSKFPVHPNDHVNMGQSSNDVIPTAIHIAIAEIVSWSLLPSLTLLQDSLELKRDEFDEIIKLGRTHLQDATPVRLGQEFGGYAEMIKKSIKRVETGLEGLMELALGGTAVGTGLNTHKDFPEVAIKVISELTNINFSEASDHFEAQSCKDSVVFMSSAFKTLAVSLSKIANDIRWAGSGPFGGIGELILPEVQPGSSIMPGKINPVIPESVLQISAKVIGNDTTITICGQSGNFQLNTMMPLIGFTSIESGLILTNGINTLREKCISGLKVDISRCNELVEKSLAMVTSLTPEIGYDAASNIAKEAYLTGRTIREILKEKNLIDEKKIEELLDPMKMTGK